MPEKVKETPEAMAELIRRRGKSSVDDISVLEIPKVYRPAVKSEIKRIEEDQKEKEEEEK